MAHPNRDDPVTVSVLPNRIACFTDSEEPMHAEPMTDSALMAPTAATPFTSIPDPNVLKARTESVLPILTASLRDASHPRLAREPTVSESPNATAP